MYPLFIKLSTNCFRRPKSYSFHYSLKSFVVFINQLRHFDKPIVSSPLIVDLKSSLITKASKFIDTEVLVQHVLINLTCKTKYLCNVEIYTFILFIVLLLQKSLYTQLNKLVIFNYKIRQIDTIETCHATCIYGLSRVHTDM